MGKKRRYIQRVKKFGTKMFNFLDKVDGQAADGILDTSGTKIDNIIESVFVTDRGNQTIKLDARAIGANFTGESITYTVNALTADTIAVNTGGSGRDKFRFPSAEPAVDGGDALILLTPGSHTVTAQITGGTHDAPLVSKTFNIARSAITMTPNADFLKVHADTDNIQMNLDEITIVGNRPGEEVAYDPSSSDGIESDGDSFKISATMKIGDDAAALAAASHAAVDITPDAGAENHTNKQIAKLLDADVASGKHVEVIVTLTARTAADADLVDTMTDTITFVVT
jgi:hypothetical protein